MHAFERRARRDSSKAGQVSSSVFGAKAPMRLHGPGRGPSRVAMGTSPIGRGKRAPWIFPFSFRLGPTPERGGHRHQLGPP